MLMTEVRQRHCHRTNVYWSSACQQLYIYCTQLGSVGTYLKTHTNLSCDLFWSPFTPVYQLWGGAHDNWLDVRFGNYIHKKVRLIEQNTLLASYLHVLMYLPLLLTCCRLPGSKARNISYAHTYTYLHVHTVVLYLIVLSLVLPSNLTSSLINTPAGKNTQLLILGAITLASTVHHLFISSTKGNGICTIIYVALDIDLAI